MKYILIRTSDADYQQLKQQKGKQTWLEMLKPKQRPITLAAVEELIELKLSKLKRGY